MKRNNYWKGVLDDMEIILMKYAIFWENDVLYD